MSEKYWSIADEYERYLEEYYQKEEERKKTKARREAEENE